MFFAKQLSKNKKISQVASCNFHFDRTSTGRSDSQRASNSYKGAHFSKVKSLLWAKNDGSVLSGTDFLA